VFSKWFRQEFGNPHNFYQARSNYVKSTAVISIIGYIMGLGDRHGENILMNSETGETVHVDFNIIFNKGETLAVPERVPFRLTSNMVDAMGPLGVEGPFRKCCEITLRVLQKEANSLICYLRPFAYDEIINWSKGKTQPQEINQEGYKNLKGVASRLNGHLRTYKTVSMNRLSVEGQVSYLISAAMDVYNLSLMFNGWSAHI